MYEQFGGLVDQNAKTVTFQLFIPDGERAPSQYEGGGLPRIKDVSVVGSFQDPAHRRWDLAHPVLMTASDYVDPADGELKGLVYAHTTAPLPDGFYEYKYFVRFENASPRLITDPCARYGGTEQQNSGFVVGGHVETVRPLAGHRLPFSDLIIYELMIDDFTSRVRHPNEAPLETVVRKLDELVRLGINAIEFMPWTAWAYADDPGRDFSWGYNPVQYFSVSHRYTHNPSTETDKLVYLKRLISECHNRGLHVIMDGVFNHADAAPPDRGFPYYWLYQDPADSPYVGNFAEHAFFQDLDYANQCTLEYIRDACIYWIDTLKIDGIRFDNTLGMYRPGDRGHGLPKLLAELRAHLSRTGNPNFSLILEHEWNYSSVAVTNNVGATSCWLDPYRSLSMSYLGDRPAGFPQVEPPIMRMLDSGRDFDPGRAPTTYIENHDHQRFMRKAGGRTFWYLTQPYIIALFTSAGAPLIYNGQEYGADNDMPEDGLGRVVPRPLDWDWLLEEPGLTVFERYRQMMEIRRAHPALRSSNFYPRGWDESNGELNQHGFGINRARNVVVYHRWGDDGQGHLERFYIVLNFSQQTQHVSFEVPNDGPYTELLSNMVVSPSNGRLNVDIGSNWGGVYYRKS
ncbi:MAG TPA: alpha-amylase family glycosyl hydrolase [Pyrinomonadaceae bacterium]|jgi:glycosidase